MKKAILFNVLLGVFFLGNSQEIDLSSETLLQDLAISGCECVDSIETFDRHKEEITEDINKCLNEAAITYQMGSKLMEIDLEDSVSKSKSKSEIDNVTKEIKVNVNINADENSEEYQKYYYELERYMMDSCASLKSKVANFEKLNEKSLSESEIALDFYSKGIDEVKKENYEEALGYFQKAVEEDPEFAFAWDNLGVNYRRLDMLDKAIEAYERSLEIDPKGMMPLQNIAVAYQYNKEYKKAIKAYKKLAKLDKGNPEVYYGIGHVYAVNLKEYEKGLDNLCKAYNIYIEQKSPYRSDAEKMINFIYTEMKKNGDDDKFNEILQSNNIRPN